MQVTETLNQGLKRGYTITVTADELDAKVNEKLVEARPGIEMKGFRKGKVPMTLLKKRLGARLMGEVMQESIDGAMTEHFEKSGDRPAFQPEVKMTNENWQEGEDVTVDMAYEALPEIPQVDLSGVELERLVVKADDTAIAEALENLAKQAQTFQDREEGSKARDGDQVTIDFLGKIAGEVFDGGAAEDYPLVLGSNSFIPGFEAQLIDAKAGDEVEIKVSLPENYAAANLAGKDAVFECIVKAVKAPNPAEIDDALAKRFGAEHLEALKDQIQTRLEAGYADAARAVMKRKLLDALDGMVKFDLPPTLVETEARQIAHQLWHEENPDVQRHDHEPIEPKDEHSSLAERRVRLGLLLAELGRKNDITVSDAEMTQAVMNQARQHPGQERQFFEFVQKNAQMRQQIQAPLFENKVVDFVFEQAKVTEKNIAKAELEKAFEALDEE